MLFSASSLCEWTCTLAVGVAKSEVYDSDGSVVVNEQILRFEVSMHDVELMDVLDASDDLLEDGAGFVLGDSAWGVGYFLHLTM